MSVKSATKNQITLKGSAQIVAEYLKYAVNSILFQRGIYPAETFENAQHYGITILMSKDQKISEFLQTVLRQTEEWIAKNLIHKISLVISNVYTKEVLECWDFKIEPSASDENDKGSINTSGKALAVIQNEIRDVMRQISATVSYLPLIEGVCTFDVMIHAEPNCDVPQSWDETGAICIHNAQTVQLRNFSTGCHKVETIVNYKMNP